MPHHAFLPIRFTPIQTVAIYGHEDRYSQHRWGADQSFMALPTRRMSDGEKTGGKTGGKTVGVAMGPGDSMYVSCTFDTRAASNAASSVAYGVGHGEEMCGQLVYYYPFAADVGAAGAMRRPEPRDDEYDRDGGGGAGGARA